MPRATIDLPDGTRVTIDGTPQEVQALVEYYQARQTGAPKPTSRSTTKPLSGQQKKSVDHSAIVMLVKTIDEAENIERNILDRTSQVDRTLLPLYIVHEHLGGAYGLTSGDVSKITTELGIPIATANASRTLSGTASRYVIADQMRKKGRAIRYKLSRRGARYMKSVIAGSGNED
jgi:hypothetical protein